MSWNKSFTSKQAFESAAEQATGREAAIAANGPDTGHAYDEAVKAAGGLIHGGGIGGADKDFSVSLSGHSNPGHEPKAGWSNDFISITVSQK